MDAKQIAEAAINLFIEEVSRKVNKKEQTTDDWRMRMQHYLYTAKDVVLSQTADGVAELQANLDRSTLFALALNAPPVPDGFMADHNTKKPSTKMSEGQWQDVLCVLRVAKWPLHYADMMRLELKDIWPTLESIKTQG